MIDEKIIVSLTTWPPRMANIPTVLDTIFRQTICPDLVVLNLAKEDNVPDALQKYIDLHSIEVNMVPNTKVYKKLIPTLRKYPNAIVISIDDDWLYPQEMIEDFIDTHTKSPNFPISGNHDVIAGMQCHCGCASLTKAEYFGEWLDKMDADVIKNCPSDDIVYTFFANKAGHPYIRTAEMYFTNMMPYGAVESYTSTQDSLCFPIEVTRSYLVERFGDVDTRIVNYLKDLQEYKFLKDVEMSAEKYFFERGIEYCKQTNSFKLGDKIVRPLKKFRSLLETSKK